MLDCDSKKHGSTERGPPAPWISKYGLPAKVEYRGERPTDNVSLSTLSFDCSLTWELLNQFGNKRIWIFGPFSVFWLPLSLVLGIFKVSGPFSHEPPAEKTWLMGGGASPKLKN